MKTTNSRLAALEAKLRPAAERRVKPWVMFESSESDPNLFVGPGGILLNGAGVDAYQRENHCRIIEVHLDRNWLEVS